MRLVFKALGQCFILGFFPMSNYNLSHFLIFKKLWTQWRTFHSNYTLASLYLFAQKTNNKKTTVSIFSIIEVLKVFVSLQLFSEMYSMTRWWQNVRYPSLKDFKMNRHQQGDKVVASSQCNLFGLIQWLRCFLAISDTTQTDVSDTIHLHKLHHPDHVIVGLK